MHYGYTESSEVKVIRRKHRIVFGLGSSAKSLKEMLEHVPDDATVDEVVDDVNDDNNTASIEFHEEKRED